jgi:hypothetical protein
MIEGHRIVERELVDLIERCDQCSWITMSIILNIVYGSICAGSESSLAEHMMPFAESEKSRLIEILERKN